MRNQPRPENRFSLSTLKRGMISGLAFTVFLSGSPLPALSQTLDSSKPVRGQVSIARDVNIVSGDGKIPSLKARDASLHDILHMLAQQGNFNIIVDSTVTGDLTVDIENISINKALEYIFTLYDLTYTKDGNTVMVTTRSQADTRNLNARTFKSIPVQYKDASNVATQLNNTIFRVARPGGTTSAVVQADPDSNSLLVMGTDSDIKLVGQALRELDVPRNRKVYSIKHNRPWYVAQVLAANFFTSNGPGASANSGGSASSSSSSAGSSGTSGGSSGGASSGSGSAGGGSAPSADQAPTTFTIGGVTFIPEPFSATLTVLATDEQLALIDSIIEKVDVRRPQAAIELSLVEIQNTDLKSLMPTWDTFNLGRLGRVTLFGNSTGTNVIQFANPFLERHEKLARPDNLFERVSFSHRNQNLRGKVLANPTLVTMDGVAATLNITDQVPTISVSNTIVNGVQTIASTITTQQAGVTMTVTPRIFNDGSLELNLSPNVSQPIRTVEATDSNGNTTSTVLLATRSMTLNGVRVRDGETLVIGGLLRESSQLDLRKAPAGLDKLPVLSSMFRSVSGNSKDKTELVLMVTPHILKEDAVSYFDGTGTGKFTNPNQGNGFQPVSLPRFIGSPSTGSDPAVAAPKIEPEQPANHLQKSMKPPLHEKIPDRLEMMELSDAFKTRKPEKKPALPLPPMEEIIKK